MKKLLPILIIVGVLVMIVPMSANACWWNEFGCYLKSTLLWGIALIAYIVGFLGSLMVNLAAGLVDLMINFNISALADGSLVPLGFGIVLNIVNLLFVLAIIVIAFGTILRLEHYGMKQLLAKLIIAVILINFSLMFAGLLLDFSHIFTTFFLSGGAPSATGSINVSDNLAGVLAPQDYSSPPTFSDAEKAVGIADLELGPGWLGFVVHEIFNAIFTWVLAIILFGVAFMFLIRYFYVVILLILMPLAWFFLVVPDYSYLSKNWWNKFLEQVFFLPAMSFFIYLAIVLENKVLGIVKASINTDGLAVSSFNNGLGSTGFFQTIVNQLLIGGILIGGLIASQKMGIAGSATAMGFGKAFRQGFVGKKPKWMTAKGLGEKAAAGVARIPVARTLLRPFSENVRKAVRQRGAAAEVKNSSQIASDVRSGKLSLDTARARAGSTWRRFVPFFSRQRANSILALAQLESGGKYTVGGPEGAEWEHPEVSEKEARLINAARERHSKIAKEKAGPSLEEKVKKLEEKSEEEKEKKGKED